MSDTKELNRAVVKAAEEIDGGRWIDDEVTPEKALDGMGLALVTGRLDEVQRKTAFEPGSPEFVKEMEETRSLAALGRHPRVIEAIAKLEAEREQYDGKRPDYVIENEWKLWEMTRDQVAKNQWEGQQRWQGRENEEMRMGTIMAPGNFYEQLVAVIGPGRVIRGNRPDFINKGDKSGRVGLYVPNPAWRGEGPIRYKQCEAARIREAGEEHLKRAKRLRLMGRNSEADKEFDIAAQAGEAAGAMHMEIRHEQVNNPELLRVATLQWPAMTEWMVMHFDEFGVPLEAKYLGWRTALLTLIRTKAITEAEAHLAFPVGTGEAAYWYLEQLYRMRSPAEPIN